MIHKRPPNAVGILRKRRQVRVPGGTVADMLFFLKNTGSKLGKFNKQSGVFGVRFVGNSQTGVPLLTNLVIQKTMHAMKRIIFALFVALLFSSVSEASEAERGEVNWLSMEEAVEKAREEPRMIFVDVYTDWCGFCRRMEAETFSHPVIASYLNDNFYPVKLNAEQEGPIEFRGTVYENNNIGERRPTHDFAIALLQGRMSYPTVVFFDENVELLTAIPGFRPPANMEAVLAFFHEGVYKETNDLESFIQNFEGQAGQ